jgi:drug/metabolite transporter (DMT)-like permease
MTRVLMAMTVGGLAAAVGQVLLRIGMQQVGELASFAPAVLWRFGIATVVNPWVVGGTALNAAFYGLFLASLSWSGITVVLPLSAIEYAFAAALAIALLGEVVTPLHWAGILLVSAGVALISVGAAR